MKEYNSDLVIDILRKEYPEIDTKIRQRINELLPENLQDLELIPKIINSFKIIKGLNYNSWISLNQNRSEVNDNRDLLFSIVLLYYHPEKILRMTDNRTRYGLISKMSNELKCSSGVLKNTLHAVIVAFRAYKDFREETYRLYNLINIENNFFN